MILNGNLTVLSAHNAGTTNQGTLTAGTFLLYAQPVPTDDQGGGVTFLEFNGLSSGTCPAASAPILSLVALNSTGAVAATISTLGSAAFKVNTVREGTMSTQWIGQADGYYDVAVEWKQTAALSLGTLPVSVGWAYVQGK